MARRPDAPEVQAAKGDPRQRGKSTVKKRLAEARRVASLLAEAPAESGDALAPPRFLDEKYPAAIAVWRQMAPELAKTHRLSRLHRLSFATFCCYYAEWVWATDDIALHGHTQSVPLTGGIGFMERMRPAVKIREIAMGNIMALVAHFGLTPTEEYKLFAHQRIAATANPGLFGDQEQASPTPTVEGEAPPPAPVRQSVGGLSGLDSEPPAGRPN